MDPALTKARQFEALLAAPAAGPYEYASIFDATTWGGRRRSRRKFKLLQRLDRRLSAALQPGERVLYLTWGVRVSFLESYFGGWAMYYLNRRAIAVTDRRLLLLQVDSRLRPRELATQLRYEAIVAIERTTLGNTRLVPGDGRKAIFSRVPAADRRFLQELLEQHRAAELAAGVLPQPVGFEDLCPHCFAVVPGRPAACPECGDAYKSRTRAALLSLLFPGLGDFYLGHRGFAALEIFVALIYWLNVLGAALVENVPGPAVAVFALAFFLIVHGLDALVTRYVANKGLYPARAQRDEPRNQAAAPAP